MDTFLVFIMFLCPLIFFHELGHFLFAKLFKVKVETFSIGFGPKVLKKVWGETEYAISLIPLGGYVKMYGDDPFKPRDLADQTYHRTYVSKSAWQKLLIVFGGPLANFLMAFGLYTFLPLKGELSNVFTIGDVTDSVVLTKAGFKSGDEILSVQGKTVRGVEDLAILRGSIGDIEVLRDGQLMNLHIDLGFMEFIDEVSNAMFLQSPKVVNSVGRISTIKFTNDEKSYPYQKFLDRSLLEDISIDIFDEKNNRVQTIKVAKGTWFETMQKESYFSLDLLVDDVVKGSPAQTSGMLKGDILHSMNGEVLKSFLQMRDNLQVVGSNKEVEVSVWRKGEPKNFKILPVERKLNEGTRLTIGVMSSIDPLPQRQRVIKLSNWVDAVSDGFLRMLVNSKKTWDGFVAMFSMPNAMEMIGGPIKIAQVAKASIVISIDHFLRLMALISINLAILNLLPVPVLDGGHIIFILLEAVRGKQLPVKALEWSYRVGFALIMSLVFVALYNDLFR